MASKDYKCGVFINNELLKEVKQGQAQRTALLGQIVKIESNLTNGNVAVKFLKEGETWESTKFYCPSQNLALIPDKLWPYLHAVSSPQERVKVATDRARCEKLCNMTKDITVEFMDKDGERHLGKIMYLGFVRGMGHCVGIKLHVSSLSTFKTVLKFPNI